MKLNWNKLFHVHSIDTYTKSTLKGGQELAKCAGGKMASQYLLLTHPFLRVLLVYVSMSCAPERASQF